MSIDPFLTTPCYNIEQPEFCNAFGSHKTQKQSCTHRRCEEELTKYNQWVETSNHMNLKGKLPAIGFITGVVRLSEVCQSVISPASEQEQNLEASNCYQVATSIRSLFEIACLGFLCCPIDCAVTKHRQVSQYSDPTGGLLKKKLNIQTHYLPVFTAATPLILSSTMSRSQ